MGTDWKAVLYGGESDCTKNMLSLISVPLQVILWSFTLDSLSGLPEDSRSSRTHAYRVFLDPLAGLLLTVWKVDCSHWLSQHFFRGIMRDCAPGMGLKFDFEWFSHQTQEVFRLPGVSALTHLCRDWSPAQVCSTPCPLQAPGNEGASVPGVAMLIDSKDFWYCCSAAPISSFNWCPILNLKDSTSCSPGSVLAMWI